MLTYFTLADFKQVKEITREDAGEDWTLGEYLERATDMIDNYTHRTFFPYYDIKRYPVPSMYADLNNRALLTGDLDLGADILEVVRVQTGSYSGDIDTGETVESGGITARTTVLSVSDADGLDAAGNTRFSVGDLLGIDDEGLLVIAVDTTENEVTVQRGMFDSRPVSHNEGTVIYRNDLQQLTDSQYFTKDYNYWPRWGLKIVWPQTWGGNYVATVGGIRYPSIYVTGLWGFHNRYPQAWIDTTDELTAAVTATDTTLPIQTGSGFDSGFDTGFEYTIGSDITGKTRFAVGQLIRLDDEFMAVTAVNATARTLTVQRGVNGSIALAHAAATLIDRWDVHPEVRGACFSIAKILREADVAKGGRIGINEVSEGFEVGIPTDVKQSIRRLVRGML